MEGPNHKVIRPIFGESGSIFAWGTPTANGHPIYCQLFFLDTQIPNIVNLSSWPSDIPIGWLDISHETYIASPQSDRFSTLRHSGFPVFFCKKVGLFI